MHLRYQSPLNRATVTTLLLYCELAVTTQIKLLGPESTIPVSNDQHKQAFVYGGSKSGLFIGNNPPHLLSWGNVKDLLKGLAMYCKDSECSFEFDVGSDSVGWGLLDGRLR